jgi:hypothetical protein
MAKGSSGGFVSGLVLGGLVGLALAWMRGGETAPTGAPSDQPLEESRAALRARFAGPTTPPAAEA